MVKTKSKSIPDRSSTGETRAASGVGVPGHPATNGLQDTGSVAERAGQRTAELLDSQPPRSSRKKWATRENKDVMESYYASNPSQRGYRKRMHQIWLAIYPHSDISEQRLADQRSVIVKNKLLTDVELEEIQRSVCSSQSTTTVHDTSTVVEDLSDAAATAHGTPPPQAVHSPQSTAAIHKKIIEMQHCIPQRISIACQQTS